MFIKLLDSALKQKEYHQKALMMRKKIFGEVHGDVATSYNNLWNVHQALGQYIEAKEYSENSLFIMKWFLESSIVMSQDIITSWEVFMKLLERIIKEKTPWKGTNHQEKDFLRGACWCLQEVITFCWLFIKLLDSTLKQMKTTSRRWSSRKIYFGRSLGRSHQVV